MAKQQKGVVAAPSVARRMWRVLRAVLYMRRCGMPSAGRKLAMDLHLLLHRGKIAGKALGDLLTFHHRENAAAGGFSSSYAAGAGSSSSCRALEDPGLTAHEPSSRARRREAQFSCSNTASADLGGRSRRRNDGYLQYHDYDAADVARAFAMLDDYDDGLFGDDNREHPAPASYALRRIAAESPAASVGSRDGGDAQVDRQADEFIRRFYEQLRAQRSAASTPDYYYAAASPCVSTTPRAIAAGIA
jgi:hypothetical protein